MHRLELRQPADIRAPAEIINDEAPHTRRLGRISQGRRVARVDAGGAHHTDGRILLPQGPGELLQVVVVDPADGDPGREAGGGFGPGDDGHVEAGYD